MQVLTEATKGLAAAYRLWDTSDRCALLLDNSSCLNQSLLIQSTKDETAIVMKAEQFWEGKTLG